MLGSYNIVLRLLRAGANANMKTVDGETAQHIAARVGAHATSLLLTFAQSGPHPSLLDTPDRRMVRLTRYVIDREID